MGHGGFGWRAILLFVGGQGLSQRGRRYLICSDLLTVSFDLRIIISIAVRSSTADNYRFITTNPRHHRPSPANPRTNMANSQSTKSTKSYPKSKITGHGIAD
mmetsp:Transcript_15053/g.24488  ORF Transcript_15053/g.24488 Transcript_15053/m.24488 type:complete len:102 (-) Transcript_15053:121-426(-)